MRRRFVLIHLAVITALVCCTGAAQKKNARDRDVEIVPAPIQTPWDAKANVAIPFPEYPRPQLVRSDWKNLNGKWDWAISPKGANHPEDWSGKILVPFCFESELSGVNRAIKDDEWMWYHRTFKVPEEWGGKRVWINFQASDWETVVYVNGKEVGIHQEGYTSFDFDITDHLKPGTVQELVVRVWDHGGREAFVSAGKQTQGGVYEPSSGIWQTVWLEPRGAGAIESLKINGSLKRSSVEMTVNTTADAEVNVEVLDGSIVVATTKGSVNEPLNIAIPDPKAWEPNSPFLYDLEISLMKDGAVIDSVKSYCGLRDIWIDKTLKGPQIVLNGKAFFHFGPLDQGYWPMSTLTPPTEEAQEFELKYLKDIGCNMVRLHIKRNPSRWYYNCDRLGLLVWQDFICNKNGVKLAAKSGESERWKNEQVMLVDSLNNHPSVVKWIVFNEAWGQHDTENIVKWAQELLPNHIVSAASGWNDVDGLAQIRDLHDYERFPSMTRPDLEPHRAVVLGETGGFGVPVNGNNWLPMPEPKLPDSPDGRVTSKDRQGGMNPVNASADNDYISDIKRPVYSVPGMVPHYERYVQTLWLEQSFGLSGAIYTQFTDMRHEQNGWLTFDRKVSKIPVSTMHKIHGLLYTPPPKRERLVAAPSGFSNSTTTFNVKETPKRAALNIELATEELDVQGLGFLMVYLDNKLIFDDKMRHKKPESRISSIMLTEKQTAFLKPGVHELRVNVESGFPVVMLELSLDAVK